VRDRSAGHVTTVSEGKKSAALVAVTGSGEKKEGKLFCACDDGRGGKEFEQALTSRSWSKGGGLGGRKVTKVDYEYSRVTLQPEVIGPFGKINKRGAIEGPPPENTAELRRGSVRSMREEGVKGRKGSSNLEKEIQN